MAVRFSIAMVFLLGLAMGSMAQAEESVNVNQADEAELAEVLEGVGESRAEAIVDFREENGNFESPEDLVLVSGIGETTVEQNRERIQVN